MCNKHTVGLLFFFILKVVKYHGNRTAGKYYVHLYLRTWYVNGEEELQKLEKDNVHIAKWPNLEAGLKNSITSHRHNGMSFSIKMFISEVRRIKSWRRIMYTYCKMA